MTTLWHHVVGVQNIMSHWGCSSLCPVCVSFYYVFEQACVPTNACTIWCFDMAADLKNDDPHHFLLLTPPWLVGRAGSCQAHGGMRRGIRRPGTLPSLCDSGWLTMAASLTVFHPASFVPWVPNVIITARMRIIIFCSWNMDALSQQWWQRCSGAVSVVWMTRYYSSCSDNGSCTLGAIKLIHLLSPSVSTINLQLCDSTFNAL